MCLSRRILTSGSQSTGVFVLISILLEIVLLLLGNGTIKRNGSMENINELKKKYIGQRVYAGGRMKGYYGTIIDIIPDEDIPGLDWFIVSNDNRIVGEPKFERWNKNELQKIVVTTKLVPLD
jgi:hypothetical protein